MQELVAKHWSLGSALHIGDLAWDRFQHAGREHEWPTQLWFEGDEVVAWGWLRLPSDLSYFVSPARPELLTSVVDWFEERAEGDALTVTVVGDEPELAARGYEPVTGEPTMIYFERSLAALPHIDLPSGFVLRHVAGLQDVAARVAVHRAAFSAYGPSRVTEESYLAVMAAWPYRADLDWVVETPDRTFASFCLGWLDEANRVVELEPVGTHQDWRRRGLGRSACLAVMRAAADLGAERAVVYGVELDGLSTGPALYRSLSFRAYAELRSFAKSRGRR